MTVGLIVDERASEPQVEAIKAIATGAAGGPMAALARWWAVSRASSGGRSSST